MAEHSDKPRIIRLFYLAFISVFGLGTVQTCIQQADRGEPLYAVLAAGVIVWSVVAASGWWIVRRLEATADASLSERLRAADDQGEANRRTFAEREALRVIFNWGRKPTFLILTPLAAYSALVVAVGIWNGDAKAIVYSLIVLGFIASAFWAYWRGSDQAAAKSQRRQP